MRGALEMSVLLCCYGITIACRPALERYRSPGTKKARQLLTAAWLDAAIADSEVERRAIFRDFNALRDALFLYIFLQFFARQSHVVDGIHVRGNNRRIRSSLGSPQHICLTHDDG